MCSLCGVLAGRGHWTESSSHPEAFADGAPATRRAERQRRARLASTILKFYGLTLRDWEGTSYILQGGTGRTLLIENLTDLWAAADRMSGRTCDPLDASLLAALTGAEHP